MTRDFPSDGAPRVRLDFTERELGNGLHVIVHEDHHLPIAAVNLWYHVGSKNERPGKTGFAHLFEHMMFQGSANVPANGHFQHVQQAGGTLNGSTSFDRTNYFETLPAHRLELGLWLEADRMRSLRLDQQTLDTQRSVVMEERRSRYDNQPYGTMYEELFSRAWKLQPYRWPTIGSMIDIRNATLEDVREFHAMYYRPENASLCVAGDVDAEAVFDLVERHFGDIPRGNGEIYRPFVHEPLHRFQVRDFVYDAVPLPALIAGFRIPSLEEQDFVVLEIIADILTSGDSSRLFRLMVYETRTAQSVLSFALPMELPGLFVFRAVAQKGRAAADIEDQLWSALSALRGTGVSDAELRKARNRLAHAFVSGLTSVQERADLLNAARVQSNDTARINTELDRIEAVTSDDVLRVARAYLREDTATVLHYLPYPDSPGIA